jgi:hypothetical protein
MLNGKLFKSLAAAAVISLAFLAPALCDSESGGFVYGGGDSESGGVPLWGDSDSGGILWGRSESGGVRNSGAESDSGGRADIGAHNESGGPAATGSEADSRPDAGMYIKNY